MAKDIEPKLKVIKDYLKLEKEERFVIPEYQRGYSWDIQQTEKLWSDIEAFIDSNGADPYFFGTVIMDCSTDDEFNLIDGQQRTTTFLLLLKALLIKLSESLENISDDPDSEKLVYAIKKRRDDILTLLYKCEPEKIFDILQDFNQVNEVNILENRSINELYSDEVKQILKSEDYQKAESNVYKTPRKQRDNKYTNYFRNFKYFYEKLSDKSDIQLNVFARVFLEECQVIEIRSWQIEQAITMFNSLNSTGLPLSDSDIISAQLYKNSGSDKSSFNESWGKINELSDQLSQRKVIDINMLLMQFMYINRSRNKEYYNTQTESVDVTVPGLRRYFISENSKLLSNPLGLCAELSNLANSWETVRGYPLVKLLLKFNDNIKLFFAGYLSKFQYEDINEEKVTLICESLIRLFTLLELVESGYSSKNFKTFLFKMNIFLVDIEVKPENIREMFDEHIRNNWNEEEIMNSIKYYDKNILVFLNEYLYSKENAIAFDFEENVNIEHIMPASGRNIESIRNDAGVTDKDHFREIVNSLGNKILLEDEINKSIGNSWFKTKKLKSINDKAGYKNSKYGIANSLTDYKSDTWTIDDIDKATHRAAERIVKFIFAEPSHKNLPSEEDIAKIEEYRSKGYIS